MSSDFDLTFDRHYLSVALFDAGDLHVTYAGTSHNLFARKVNRTKLPDEDMHPGFTSGVYFAFAGLADVQWRSLDGDFHSFSLDLDEIFKSRKIFYSAENNHVYQADPIVQSHPTIIIEVDNRKLTVYMHVGINTFSPNTNDKNLYEQYFTSAVFSKLF